MNTNKMIFMLAFLSFSLMPNITDTPTATLTTNKPNYALRETVFLTFTSTYTAPIKLTRDNSWEVYKKSGTDWMSVYSSDFVRGKRSFIPDESVTWKWEQRSITDINIEEGTYKVTVYIKDVGIWCTTFTISGGGTVSATLDTNSLDYALKETVYFTYTNTDTEPIEVDTLNPWTIYRLSEPDCPIVYEPLKQTQKWTIGPGESKTWEWNQESTTHTIGGGTYKVEVHINDVGTWFTTFTVGRGEPASAVLTTTSPNYDIPGAATFMLTNTGTVPITCGEDEQIALYRRTGLHWELIYVYPATPEEWAINPDESKSWGWAQTRTKSKTGGVHYEAEVTIPGTGIWCARFTFGDKDQDNIPDDQDKCFNPECSWVDGWGCPIDRDGDGLDACEDKCPDYPGPESNNGCPQQGVCSGSVVLSVLVLMGALVCMKRPY